MGCPTATSSAGDAAFQHGRTSSFVIHALSKQSHRQVAAPQLWCPDALSGFDIAIVSYTPTDTNDAWESDLSWNRDFFFLFLKAFCN